MLQNEVLIIILLTVLGIATILGISASKRTRTSDKESSKLVSATALTHLEACLDAANIPMLIIDQNLSISYASKSLQNLINFVPKALIGASLLELIHREDQETAKELILQQNQAHEVSQADVKLRRAGDGWIRVRAYSSRLSSNLILLLIQDVSLTESLRVQLEIERAKIEIAERVANLGLWERDTSTGQEVWSDQTFKIYGLKPGSLEPSYEYLLSIVHPDDRARVDSAYRDTIKALSTYDVSYRILLPDNSIRVVHSKAQIVKGADSRLLLTGTVQDVTEQKVNEESLLRQALHDPLTGLPNRVMLGQQLEKLLASNRSRSIAVLFLDLDNFKAVNDNLGHQAGDSLLVAVARRLSANLRPTDFAARFGGDEFTVVVTKVKSIDYVVSIAKRIIESISQPFDIAGERIYTSTSIGIALCSSSEDSASSLLRKADIALYKSKSLGRGTYVIFDQSMEQEASEILELERNLRTAIQNDQFIVHYQPIVDAATGKVEMIEALLRWNSPNGILSPDKFIPIAEKVGLINTLGELVLNKACEQTAYLKATTGAKFITSINVSAKQLRQPHFTNNLESMLHKYDLQPKDVQLEITENALVEEVECITNALKEIKTLGIRIAIDDFGTGYSSLSYLRKLPIDLIKIDQSFVKMLPNDDEHRAIIHTIISLARSLDLEIIAEGVEEKLQKDILLSMGCRFIQGNLISHPVDLESIKLILVRTFPQVKQ